MIISRADLSQRYNLNKGQWTRRHDDLIDWLNDFMEITELKDPNTGFYSYEIKGEPPKSIPPLPRKNSKTVEKIQDYEEYVINNLPEEFTPLSKTKMSRDAINDFGKVKYNHESAEAVARRYVGPAMNKHGEHSIKMVWVNAATYQVLSEEQELFLHNCFNTMHLTELEMANAFKKYAQEQDISYEVDNFNKAIDMFRIQFGFRPISVYEWQKKEHRTCVSKFCQLFSC